MKIVDKRLSKIKKVPDLDTGQLFYFKNKVYIKLDTISVNDFAYNAVSVYGDMTYFDNSYDVFPVEGELIIT